MRIIGYEKQMATGAAATSENESEFPVENLFDNYGWNYYMAVAGVNRATLTLPILAGSDVAIFSGTNAVSAIMLIAASTGGSVIDNAAAVDLGSGLVGIPATAHGFVAGDIVLIYGSTNYDAVYEAHSSTTTDQLVVEADYVAETFGGSEVIRGGYAGQVFDLTEYDDHDIAISEEPSVQRCFGLPYAYQGAACVCYITLTAIDGETLWGGLFRAGSSVEIPDPKGGLTEGLEDYNLNQDLLNGGKFGFAQKKARVFSGQVLLERDTKFYKARNAIARTSPYPVGIMVTEKDGSIWAIIGYFRAQLSGTHDYLNRTMVSFEIVEAV